MRVLFVEVPVDGNGRPALELPASVNVERVAPGVFVLSFADDVMIVSRIGTRAGNPVFVGVTTTPNAKRFLQHLGARVMSLAEARANPTAWSWITSQTSLRRLVRGGSTVGIVPPVVVAGQGATVGLPDDEELDAIEGGAS